MDNYKFETELSPKEETSRYSRDLIPLGRMGIDLQIKCSIRVVASSQVPFKKRGRTWYILITCWTWLDMI